MQLSRNLFCPCGSGLKYKKCCIGKLTERLEDYYALLHKESLINAKLVNIASNYYSEEGLNKYSLEFCGVDFKEINDEEKHFFWDWFFNEAIDDKEKKKVILVLKEVFVFDLEEHKIMDEWISNSRAGIFEVQSVDAPNNFFVLKEIFSGKEFEIFDIKGSKQVVKGDVLFVRVQNIFGKNYLSGNAKFFNRLSLQDLKEYVKKNIPEEQVYEEFINKNSKIIHGFNPKEPEFISITGEKLKFCELGYEAKDFSKLLTLLKKNPDFLITAENYDKKGNLEYAQIVCLCKKKASANKEGQMLVFSSFIDLERNQVDSQGSITIEKNKLKFFTTSEKVFQRNKNLIEENLENFKKIKEESITPDQAMKQEDNLDEEKFEKKPDEDLIKISNQFLTKYYLDWCDTKIPYLNNKTPREAIKKQEYKEKVEELLLTIENSELRKAKESKPNIPVGEIIRKELGLD